MSDPLIYKKFDVTRRDDAPASQGPEDPAYFVLDVANDHVAVAALYTYAETCDDTELGEALLAMIEDGDWSLLRRPYAAAKEADGLGHGSDG